MKEREYLIELYMLYGNLLTDKQKTIFKKYFYEDLSLSEISENINISKSCIGKTIQIIENKLYNYEKKVKMHKKIRDICKLVDNRKLNEKIKKIISG